MVNIVYYNVFASIIIDAMKKYSTAILLANLGTPEDATPASVRSFLKVFLSDPRVVEVPRLLWLMILYGVILPFRPKSVAQAYQQLWDEYGDSPLRLLSQQQVKKLQLLLEQQPDDVLSSVTVDYVFSYGQPGLQTQLDHYNQLAEKVVVLPLYPQYSCSTTAAIYDQLAAYNKNQRYVADVHIVREYYQHAAYQAALAVSVEEFWAAHGQSEFLLISYHGVPQAYADKGDPYYQQCLSTSEELAKRLGLKEGQYLTSFQSRLGKAPWLQPYTDVTVKALAEKGIKKMDVVCPSFSVDCLETLEEIAVENKEYFQQAGGDQLRLIPCLNADNGHIHMMAEILKPYLHLN